MKYVTPLSDTEIETLQQMHAHHPSRRARIRAHSLLLRHQRYAIPQIARLDQVDQRRGSAWIARWQAWGLVGVYDRPRSGRPTLFNAEEQQKVYAYLGAAPKDVKKVVEAISNSNLGSQDVSSLGLRLRVSLDSSLSPLIMKSIR
jgi:hypothetical protein